jgi:hypothetical protein
MNFAINPVAWWRAERLRLPTYRGLSKDCSSTPKPLL